MMEAMTDGTDTIAGFDPFDPHDVEWQPVSSSLTVARRLLCSACILLPFAVAVLIAVLTTSLWAWVGVGIVGAVWLWLMWLVPRQVKAWGYAQRADDLLIRHGVMFRTLVVVPYGRMQMVDVQSGPLARLFGIATVQLHTASADTDAQIPGLRGVDASALRDRLAVRGEARMAGL